MMIQGYHLLQCKTATISSTAKAISDFGFSSAELLSAKAAVITSHSFMTVFTLDGSTPTATHGHVIKTNDMPLCVYGAPNVNNLKFIRKEGSDSIVTVTLYGT